MGKKAALNLASWSDYNTFSRFKSISAPLKYIKNQQSIPYDTKMDHILLQVNLDAKKNPLRPDVARRKRVKPGPKVSRLAFPTPAGYSTYRDYTTGKFYVDLFNLCSSHGLFEPKLLVNHALMQPWWPVIHPNPKYQADLNIDPKYPPLFHAFVRKLVDLSKIDQIKIYAHKTTSPGPPFSFAGGVPYEKHDMYYGMSDDMDNLAMMALRKDYSKIKKTYFPMMTKIHFEQVKLAELGLENFKGSFLPYYFNCIIPFAVEGYRDNSIDPVVNISPGQRAKITDKYYTKSRYVTVLLREHILTGEVDIEPLTDYCREQAGVRWGGSMQRPRGITNDSWPSQLSAFVSTKMVTQHIEEGVNGFASTKPEVMKGYKEFLAECYSIGKGDFLFLNGDRTNSETFITTNYSQFRQLILPELVKLYDLQDCIFMLGEKNYYVEGLPSGMARTTELNWIMGTYEALFTISKLLKVGITDVCDSYFNSVLDNRPFFKVGDFVIKLFMCTDDIPLIIYGDTNRIDLSFISDQNSKTRLMSWSCDSNSMRTFGMYFDSNEMRANDVSIISKLFYSEHPGFFVKDCFSLYSKLQMLPPSLRRDVNLLLEKHYNCDESFYREAGRAFLGWLSEFGIPVSEAVDIYSPTGKVIYGDLVDSDSLFESTRISSEYFDQIFKYYKDTVCTYLNT